MRVAYQARAVLRQADVGRLPQLLKAVSHEEVRRKQRALSHVWRRFLYSDYPLFSPNLQQLSGQQAEARGHDAVRHALPGSFHGSYDQDDAFGTIMEWLYHRLQPDKDAVAAV